MRGHFQSYPEFLYICMENMGKISLALNQRYGANAAKTSEFTPLFVVTLF